MKNGFSFFSKQNIKNYFRSRMEGKMKRKNWIAGFIIPAAIFTASMAFAGNISINGSTTVLPIAQKVAEAFMKEHPDTAISISGGGSGNGIKALIDKTTDIANSSRAIKKEEIEQAKAKGSNPVEFIVAFDCIVPVVHPSNPLKNINAGSIKGHVQRGNQELERNRRIRQTGCDYFERYLFRHLRGMGRKGNEKGTGLPRGSASGI